MLFRILQTKREDILSRSKSRIALMSPVRDDQELGSALSQLLDDIMERLRVAVCAASPSSGPGHAAAQHGARRHRVGVDITQLVHDYGALCQSVMEVADDEQVVIDPKECCTLNAVLDDAIAAAVEEFAHQRDRDHDTRSERREAEHLGFVAHELRNALASASLAFSAIRDRGADPAGKTGAVLGASLGRLRTIVDRAIASVRLHSGMPVRREQVRVRDRRDRGVGRAGARGE